VREELEPVGYDFPTNAKLENEAVSDYYMGNTTQKIEKATGVVVKVPELPQSERSKYVSFREDWKV
jgi:hypothetical protein